MRRLLAILLLLIPGLPLVSPLMVAAAGQDAGLPACCRRNGSHHCAAMSSATDASATPHVKALRERCPAYPGAAVSPFHGGASGLSSSLLLASHADHGAIAREQTAAITSSFDRSRHERGPPSTLQTLL